MRVLFATQSDSLLMFEALRADLDRKAGVEAAGFTVADSFVYSQWLDANPDFEKHGHYLLKEWEVTARRGGTPDRAFLASKEKELGAEAGLFGAIVADRRLFMGPDCTVTQDYRRRFTDDQLLSILQAGIEEVERLFDTLRPDLVVGFICVTMLDYLVYLVARARGVRFMNIRPTRVGDRITLGSTLNDPDPNFVTAYHRALQTASPRAKDAVAYIQRVRERHGRYEGVVNPSDKPALNVNRDRSSLAAAARRVWGNWRAYQGGQARTDNHVLNPLRALWYAAVVSPARARSGRRRLSDLYVTPETLKGRRFAFYPLHTEPEVSLLVYGRPYVNQIEIIRALAMSLPADMDLVVKEHPWMVGKRSLKAYAKMLAIPRVRLAAPNLDARGLIGGADLVCVVTGSVALESAILGKPAITFGDCPYNVLPDRLVRRCADLRKLPATVSSLLEPGERDPDDRALTAYLAATYETSASIALYSRLLGKKSVYTERETNYHDEIERLGSYVLRVLEQTSTPDALAGAADW